VLEVIRDMGLAVVGKKPMVRLLAHRAVDATGLGEEIARGNTLRKKPALNIQDESTHAQPDIKSTIDHNDGKNQSPQPM